MFLPESHVRSTKVGMSNGSQIDYESQKIKKTVLSTTVAELYSFMERFGACQLLRELWMDLSQKVAYIHIKINPQNLVTRASTMHSPEQKEPIDPYVKKGSLFREHLLSSSHFNSELSNRLSDEGISEGG